MNTYLFYDLETSGLNPSFDQVYQFAAIRTDMDLVEIERHEFWVKPTIDVIPTPKAMITHRLSIPLLEEKGEPECDVILKIHQLLNTPGTISVGYNTLSFDDEFLRFSFYRHLLTPYTHQHKEECRRMDLFPMVIFYWLFRHNCLLWETRNDHVSMKLEDLSAKNGFSTGPAHNAMVDVEATVNLARKLKEDLEVWNYLTGYFIKGKDTARVEALPLICINDAQYPDGIAVNGRFGAAQSFQIPVLRLGEHKHYKKQWLWLRLDDERILSGDTALIPELWTLKKRAAEPPFILQPQPKYDHLSENRRELAKKTVHFLQTNPDYFKAIQTYALNFKFPVHKETDIDAALYTMGFWSRGETELMQRFREGAPHEKKQLAQNFQSKKLQHLAHRYLGRFHREVLPVDAEAPFTHYLDQIWNAEQSTIVDYKLNPRLTRHNALTQIDNMDASTLDAQQIEVLAGVSDYLNKGPK